MRISPSGRLWAFSKEMPSDRAIVGATSTFSIVGIFVPVFQPLLFPR
jgi:hypothetical protein